jgi:hypothetical protein
MVVDKGNDYCDNPRMDAKTIVSEILESGMTQIALATEAQCAQSTVSSILSGVRGKRISKALWDRIEAVHRIRCSGRGFEERCVP